VHDGIEDWPLILGVRLINQSSRVDQKLGSRDMTFSHSVIDARLTILVLFVHVSMHFIDDVVDDLCVAISCRIEERSLLECIIEQWIAT